MKTDFKAFPRIFEIKGVKIKDYGKILLNEWEMVSFVTKTGKECDFTATNWGFYVCPSVNVRFKKEGFKVALVLNEKGQLYVNAVEIDKIRLFKKHLKISQNNKIICWLDEWIE